MARQLPDSELKKFQQDHYAALKLKTAEFKSQGKNPFREPVDEEGHGPGIVPQKRYDELRYQSDKYHPANKKNNKGKK